MNVQDDPFYMPSQDDELLLLVAGADNDSGFMDSQEDRLLLEVVTNEAEDNPNKKMRVKRPKLIAKYMQKSSAKKSYRM